MGFIKNLINRHQDSIIRNAPLGRILVEAALRKGDDNRLSGKLDKTARNVQAQTLKVYKAAVAAATDPDSPDRTQLSELYNNLMLDNHLASVIESRILYCQRSAFKFIDNNGNEVKEISQLFERPWFDELIYRTIFSKFKGTTLIEMYTLNADGELAEITEIPQSHFNAQSGLILKSPGDTTGWQYKDGVFTDYYVQIGKDDELGMLERLAIIVLAKKLGMGSWLDYIDKYGVPPLFITTDREDQTRLDELFKAAQNFRSNQFMIARGNEKFEIGKDTGHAGQNPFDALIERANSEMTKRVMGGSGIVDEKAFVGSAEIQFQLAKDRYESDKLFFKYVFNAFIKPRLVKLSPVYKQLENVTFTWDNSETLTQQQLIDAITKLSVNYEVDTEYIFQQTGIPILGIKQSTSIPGGNASPK